MAIRETLPNFGDKYDGRKMKQLVDDLEKYFSRPLKRIYRSAVANAATYNMPANVDFVKVPYTVTGAVTLNIALAADKAGEDIVIKDTGGDASSNNITLTGSASNLIDGATTLAISTDGGIAHLLSDGVGWYKIN